ncbi:hypothetical protein DFH08DRAFT_967582 [Mycena albidolilacea]|uniref:Uncharacterized protein n=1 Tax=Mycena albidolilacea TaxID=1033008 RepID=A0AAD6ZLK9_9AGAR|nr:hypothetical protein DFH08DRAFT_967582 [Mycena albidolilacea]
MSNLNAASGSVRFRFEPILEPDLATATPMSGCASILPGITGVFIGAKSAAALFPGSALLTLDGCPRVGTPSTCIFGYLREYFRDGTPPAAMTVCFADDPIFPSTGADNSTDVQGRTWGERRC